MMLQSLFVLLPSMVSGGILAHLIWSEREIKSILFKVFFGAGLGLGINSLLFFLFLLFFGRRPGFFGVQILLMVALVTMLVIKERPFQLPWHRLKLPGRTQILFLALTGGMVLLAASIYFTVIERKPQGAWDSWMIYNRAARFLFRGGEHWRDAFSPALYWFFHTDYPPLVALNVASGWDALGQESMRVPMLVGGAFLFASAGAMFAGLNLYKTLGQAALGLLVLFSISDYVESGAGQIADVPVAFFILATGILLFLYSFQVQKGLLVLAGLSAGLAAWTKNEGIVFALVSLTGLGVAFRTEWKEIFPWYLLGLAAPLAILVYFKIALAPPGDLFVDPPSQIRQIADASRHAVILKQLGLDLRSLVNWPLFILYALILGVDRARLHASASLACLVIILLQLAGYYGILLISPHPVLWHVSALYRLLLQIGPLIVFLFFSLVQPPESIFQAR
jgi:hypothetical protein